MHIVNLTQHTATAQQVAAGVRDLPIESRATLSILLTFDSIPTLVEMVDRATKIVALAREHFPESGSAMIGGAPFFASTLEFALLAHEIIPLYAFSVRESVEETMPDGTVRKVNTFRHIGFVEV